MIIGSRITRMRIVLAALLTLVSCCAVAAQDAAGVQPSGARQAAKPYNRAEAVAIIAELRRIVTPNGVERLQKVRIGGIDQWISIRGQDKRNPVLLMLHGGPGFVEMPASWTFQRGWEDYFTVVQWDQRGAGKTYRENDRANVASTMTFERMVEDAEDLTQWLRREFGKDKIFVLGHSWGSALGMELAKRRPQWLHAYIGVGQITDSLESERRGLAFALEQARKDGNAEAMRELSTIADYAQPGHRIELESLYLQRKWLGHYGGAVHGRKGYDAEAAAFALAPEYGDEDLAQVWDGNDLSEKALLADVIQMNYSSVVRLDCPVILFNGRHDYNVSSSVSAEWFERLSAPAKQLVWFEQSAHMPHTEEQGKFLIALVRFARPFAERAGDIAPE